MKKLISLFALGVIMVLPSACCYLDGCCDPGNVPTSSTIASLSISNGSFTPDAGISQTPTTDHNLAALIVSIDDVTYPEVASLAPHMGFITGAYACSPPEPEPSQSITSITITASDDLQLGGETLEAGTALQYYFLVAQYYESPYTLEEFINTHQNDPWLFGNWGQRIALQLAQAPDTSFESTFTIVIRFSDDAEFTLTSEPWAVE
ncbi:MAG TPA: hypothetical protein DCR93_38220 [Cytophagales bacterium]|nr:hypothetical protein [Cytophagales bacterium]